VAGTHDVTPNMRPMPEYGSRNPAVRWLFRRRLEVAGQFVAELEPESLIDVGCGKGEFVSAVAHMPWRPRRLKGVDLHGEVYLLNGHVPGVEFDTQDVRRLNELELGWHMVTCLDTLEHVPELQRAVLELNRVLCEGGHLLTCQPTETWWYKVLRLIAKGKWSAVTAPASGRHYHTAAEVHHRVTRCGFNLVSSRKLPRPPADLFHINLYVKEVSSHVFLH